MKQEEGKVESINFRCTESVKEAAQRIADRYSAGGYIADVIPYLIIAADNAITTHGDRVIWPPQINHFPPNSLSHQNLINESETE